MEKIKVCAAKNALCEIKRKKVYQPSATKIRKLATACNKAFYELSQSGVSLPVCAGTLCENFYIITKSAIRTPTKKKDRITVRYGENRGKVRAYVFAEKYLECVDMCVSMESFSLYFDTYQEISPLENNEIISLPAMIRTYALKKAESVCRENIDIINEYKQAQTVFDSLCGITNKERIASKMENISTMSCSGITRLYTLLSYDDNFAALDIMKYILSKNGRDLQSETEKDADMQTYLSRCAVNIAGTLRFSESLSGDFLLERFSRLDAVLMRDRIFVTMDNSSRSAVARECEHIASHLKVSPVSLAEKALETGDVCRSLLTDDGKAALYRAFGRQYSAVPVKTKLLFYVTYQLILAFIIFVLFANENTLQSVLCIFPSLIIAENIVRRLFRKKKRPKPLPRCDIKSMSVPSTCVAVSLLLTDEKSLMNVFDKVQTHYLCDRLENTCYVILSDFTDSKTAAISDEEKHLLSLANARTKELNSLYGKEIFCFMHRKRMYNKRDKVYMGYERKRGAIMHFIEYAISHDRQSLSSRYEAIFGTLPTDIKYCLLLDSDTVMPKNALSELIGTMAHPVNTPEVVDDRIKSGIAIAVPRMESTQGNTAFSKIMNGLCGITPYNGGVSDLYNDTFDSGIFGGKGIIDIKAFYECTQGKIADNTVLSHDMLESCFAKAAFASDIVLYDSEPENIISWWKRQHRWIRGDVQLLRYIGKADTVSDYKILSNLFRHLSPFFIMLSLWLLPYAGHGRYIALAIIAFFIDCIIDTANDIAGMIKNGKVALQDITLTWARGLFSFIALPYFAYKTFDAFVRTFFRMFISRKKLLEWKTAHQSETKPGNIVSYIKTMWICVTSGLSFLILPLFGMNGSVILGSAFIYAPFAYMIIDKPTKRDGISQKNAAYLEGISREIWEFFKQETNEEYGYIPPDNVQTEPFATPVFNTSPTNIGMAMCSTVCAYDMKYIEKDELLHRLSVMVDYCNSLEKKNGHLYNWYDIKTKKKLYPYYVSSVDSGNFVASLLYAKQVLHELNDEKAENTAAKIGKMIDDTDFSFLYDSDKDKFYIGYNGSTGEVTKAWYDLLASEARLTYYVACGLGKIPQKAWFSLSRGLVEAGNSRALVSWGGTCFEYLMPMIFIKSVSDSLLDETYHAVTEEQIKTACHKVWGVSESGYYAFDKSGYYQYHAFGSKRLGLSPMYENEKVIAPYASLLCAMVDEKSSTSNLQRLESMGMRGKYGFYEAADFTEERVQSGRMFSPVKSFMAHHQGMSMCSICNVVCDGIMQNRFASIPEMKTVEMLNCEKLPPYGTVLKNYERPQITEDVIHENTITYTEKGRYPRGKVYTEGNIQAYISDSVPAYIKCGDICITRQTDDFIRSIGGFEMYIKADGNVYPLMPIMHNKNANIKFDIHECESRLETDKFTAEVVSSVVNDALCIRISIINHTHSEIDTQIGAFCDIVLATQSEFIQSPSFSRLKIESSCDDEVIYFVRKADRDRRKICAYGGFAGKCDVIFGNDGSALPGRKGSYYEAMKKQKSTIKEVPVYPVMSAKANFITRDRHDITFVIGAAEDMQNAKEKFAAAVSCDFLQCKSRAWAMNMSALYFMGIPQGQTTLFDSMITYLLLGIPQKPPVTEKIDLCIDALYKFGISERDKILLYEVINPTMLRQLKMLIKFIKYAVYKCVECKLVVICGGKMSYNSGNRSYVDEIISASVQNAVYAEKIILINEYDITKEEKKLLYSVADIVYDNMRSRQFVNEKAKEQVHLHRESGGRVKEVKRPPLEFENEYGGYDSIHKEYAIYLTKEIHTPLPWTNIVCSPDNPGFGFAITESGGGYMWKTNSHEDRVTLWCPDELYDVQNETVYIEDEYGDVRSITHGRLQGDGTVVCRHGYGYSIFENENAICSAEMTVFCDETRPQKIASIMLCNDTPKDMNLYIRYMIHTANTKGAYTYFRDGMGFCRSCMDNDTVYVCIKNADSVKFSGDREGNMLYYSELSDVNTYPFMALRAKVSLCAYEKRHILIITGKDEEEKAKENSRISLQTANEMQERIKKKWLAKTGGVTVKTPDAGFDFLVNNRLLYQVYASRLIGRTGYYQSGGAIGYRDQLQDTMALCFTDSLRLKSQILLCASKQFEKGDVLHWWHSPSKGVRTHITDDRLFLPLAVAKYIKSTGDMSILDISVPYLRDEKIKDGKKDLYMDFKSCKKEDTVLMHCINAITSVAKFGTHDLPLMGGGDWNDGMDCVGENGGESVFLALFLEVVINEMLKIASVSDDAREKLIAIKSKVHSGIEKWGFEKDRFLRAYFGNSEPLGSSKNKECSIDLLTQCFAVFANERQALIAMQTAEELLTDKQSGIIKLLTPPFSGSGQNYAGYIESYAKGVRENGGQYTHAAAWYVIALCCIGKNQEAVSAFSMINPINKDTDRYMGEPYAVAGDVYDTGRCGWTWYTGSAGWLYTAGIEYIAGIKKHGKTVTIEPHNPWQSYDVSIKVNSTRYELHIVRTNVQQSTYITDGVAHDCITLDDDGKNHVVLCRVRE